MKTNSVSELLKAKGVQIPTSETTEKPVATHGSKKTRLYHFDKEDGAASPKNSELSPAEALADREQSVSRPLAKRKQKDAKSVSKALADREQSVSKEKGANALPLAKALAVPLADREQSVSKPLAITAFNSLVGKERDLILLIFESCQASGNLESPIFTSEELCDRLKIHAPRLRNLVFRLVHKNVFSVIQLKKGRASNRRFKLQNDLFQAIHLGLSVSRPLADREQSVSRPLAKALAKALAEPPCSSSIINTNTTTTDPTKLLGNEPDLWLSVPGNLEGLVSVNQLKDFVRQGLLSISDLQTSLDGFSYDLEKGTIKSKSGNPVAILIGSVKRGGYISQNYLTELRNTLAEIDAARAELKKFQEENTSELLRIEFESFKSLFPEEAEKFKPSAKFINSYNAGSVGYRMWLDEFKRRKPASAAPEA
jgi:hypothetical protein